MSTTEIADITESTEKNKEKIVGFDSMKRAILLSSVRTVAQ
jgi:hypothetical protein